MSRPNTVKPESYPDAAGVTWRPRGADSSADSSPGSRGGKSWATRLLTWAGWPRLEGGPGILVPSRIPPGRPGPPTNRREVSIPRPHAGGLSGRRGRRNRLYGVFSGPALWDFPSGKGDRSTRLNAATLAGISGSARHGWLTFGGRIRALPPPPPPRSRALAGGSFNPRRTGRRPRAPRARRVRSRRASWRKPNGLRPGRRRRSPCAPRGRGPCRRGRSVRRTRPRARRPRGSSLSPHFLGHAVRRGAQ